MCVELRELRSNGAIRVSNEGQNTFCPSYHNMTYKKQLLSGEFRSFPKAIAAFDITDACPANLQ